MKEIYQGRNLNTRINAYPVKKKRSNKILEVAKLLPIYKEKMREARRKKDFVKSDRIKKEIKKIRKVLKEYYEH